MYDWQNPQIGDTVILWGGKRYGKVVGFAMVPKNSPYFVGRGDMGVKVKFLDGATETIPPNQFKGLEEITIAAEKAAVNYRAKQKAALAL